MRLMVHINGWPGVGKLTIARLLADRLGARLLDNHTLLNPAEALFDRSDPAYWPLRQEVRSLVLRYVDQLADDVPLVLTDALADDEQDRAQFGHFRELADRHQARLVSAVLACDLDENRRRIVSPERGAHHKLTSLDVLADLKRHYLLLRPSDIDVIDLDVTNLTAEQAAQTLGERLVRLR